MRRALRLPGLGMALVVGVLGSRTVAAQVPDAPPIPRTRLRLAPAGHLDWKVAERLDRRLRARGIAVTGESAPAAVRSPLPVPAMPLSAELAATASAPETGAATLIDGEEPLSPSWKVGFRALGDNSGATPPNTQGAVGGTELLTALSTQVKRQDRNGGPIGSTLSLYGFWFTAGVSPALPPYRGPRVVFDPDPAPGHFVMVTCQAEATQNSALLLAVSTGGTAASWYAWKIPADPGNLPGSGVWLDEPTVGFNRKWIVVQVNVYHYGTATDFVGSRVYVFDKDRLRQGLPSTPTVFDLAAASFRGTQVPAATYDVPANDLYLVQRWTHDNADGYGYLRLYQLTGAVGSEALNPQGFARAPAWSDSAPGMVDFAPQGPGCGTNRIQTNDSRIQNVVQRASTLWAAQTVFYPAGGAPGRASVQWWQLGLDAAVLQTGLVDDPANARFYAFPSIAVNQHGDALLGFSTFSATDTASAGYAFRLAGDPPGTMQQPQVLKAGEACYYKAPPPQNLNRWGDYSAAQVDPLDDTSLWTLQEYAASTDSNNSPALNVWSTWWGKVEPPLVSIADASVAEGNTGTTALTFNLALSVAVSDTVSVHWQTADGSATAADNDYVPAGGDVTFAPNQTAASVTVDVVGDLRHELDEQFTVVLSSPKLATLGNTQATGTILNDEPAPLMSIGDAQVVEGDTGSINAVFTVSLSYPSTVLISAGWLAKADTATLNVDFGAAGGTVTFDPGVVTRTVTVPVFGDTLNEGNETFTVELSPPSVGTLLKKIGVGLILDDDQNLFEPVSGPVVVSDGDSATGRNRLQWLNPTPRPSGVRIRFVAGTTPCPVIGLGGEPWGTLRPDGEDVDLGPTPPAAQSWPHLNLILNTDYCYGVWAYYGGSSWSSSAVAKGRPFDATGKVKWKYNTGMTALANPTVGQAAVLAPGNDRFVHAMTPGPGPAGGGWPPLWVPVNLGSEAQARSPIIPIGGVSLALYTTQDGWVHAIDAATGARLWDVQIATGPTSAQAAPAAILAGWGGGWDYLLVGTRMASGNKVYALDPLNGSVIDVFPRGTENGISGLGPINGMAAVDYPSRRVYFGSMPGTVPDAPGTLWCLQLGPPSDALTLGWSTSAPGPIETSPVVRGDRVYVGDMNGVVWSVRRDGANTYSIPLLDGKVKGFPWPDRRNNQLYVTTQTKVWGLTDTVGSSLSSPWSVAGLDSPSQVLLKPGTNDLYVGVRDIVPSGPPDSAGLLRIDVGSPDPASSVTAVAIEDSAMIVGPPSLDIRPTPNMIYVGSDGGVIYAVEASF